MQPTSYDELNNGYLQSSRLCTPRVMPGSVDGRLSRIPRLIRAGLAINLVEYSVG